MGPFQDSYDLAIDTVNSKLYISDFDANAIYRCDLDGKNLVEFRTGLPGPDGMAIDYAQTRFTGTLMMESRGPIYPIQM